jgi:peptide/nickel transport system permease protein
MKGYRQFLVRGLWAVVSVWLVLTLIWAFVALTDDPNRAAAMFGAALDDGNATAAGQQYDAARGRTGTLLSRYLDAMTNVVTLDWGMSVTRGRPVVDVVARSLVVTGTYLLPAAFVAVSLGSALGVFATVERGSVRERVVLALGYLGVSVPSFVVALFGYRYVVRSNDLDGPVAGGTGSVGPVPVPGLEAVTGAPAKLAVAGVAVATLLLATQLRYTRSESLEQFGTPYVKTARAKGAGRWRVARHAVRNAALTLVSLLFTELLGVLVVTVVIVEAVLGIPGLGAVLYGAADGRDLPLLLGASLVPVVFGVAANLLQDVAYQVLDPRVGEE